MPTTPDTSSEASPLTELLRRCHRSELVPLAQVLGVGATRLPLDKLAAAIDKRVRRAADHELRNAILRGGDGPTWSEALQRFCRRKGIAVQVDIEASERAILDWWVQRFWARIDGGTREQLWGLLELPAPPPEDGTTALATVKAEDRHAYLMTRPSLRGLAMGLFPGGGCLTAWYLGRPRDDLFVPAVLEVAHLRQALRHRVTVGIVGSPSSGKDAAINAIFGIPTGNVNPVAGSTTTVEITRLPDATALFVVNTPGMGDVVESVTERAREVLDVIDVYVYVVNAQGGVQLREKTDYDLCVASGRPVLAVVNKIDTLKPADRERYLDDARDKLGASPQDFLAAAFDPLPQLSETPIGLDAVRAWIEDRLTGLGKDASELPWVEGRPGD